MPSARPPHRDTPQVSAQDRLAMVSARCRVSPLVVDARELQRDKPSYTIDTLESMRAELAAMTSCFCFWAGTHFAACPLAPLGRVAPALPHPGAATPGCRQRTAGCLAQPAGSAFGERPAAMSGPSGQIAFVWQTPLAVSATQIRQLLASGKSVRFLVPDAVLAYIDAHGLYRASN
jgi:nicotinate-nucleotide adenylyltransferase